MQEGDSDNTNRQIYVPFNTMSDLKDTKYIDGVWFSYSGDNELIEKSLRETMGAAHHFRPTDHNAMYVANLMTQLHQLRFSPSPCRFCSRWWARSRWASPASV